MNIELHDANQACTGIFILLFIEDLLRSVSHIFEGSHYEYYHFPMDDFLSIHATNSYWNISYVFLECYKKGQFIKFC